MKDSTWRHLAARLIEFLSAAPLRPEERALASAWLRPEEEVAFFAQNAADQRHGLAAGCYLAGQTPDRVDLIRAGLLHDIGKRHSGLGAFKRSLTTAWVKLGGRALGRGASYIDHGEIGAGELERLGCEPLVVAFARYHHRQRPPSITLLEWQLLQAGDRARSLVKGAGRLTP